MNRKRVLISLLALLATCGVWAEPTWTVTTRIGTKDTFIVTRSESTYAQTVLYRTVNISAYAGQHYTAASGSLTFGVGETVKKVSVSRANPNNNAYLFQNGTSRSYRFEVTDQGGFYLAHKVRDLSTGTNVTSSGVFDTKDVTIQTSEYTADDRGYDNNGYKSVGASSYCTSGTQAYLGFLNAQLRMTLSFQAKENDDAYEYLQILFDNTSTCDNRSGASNGNPGTPNLSRYMAGFEMNTDSKDDSYRSYTFPVTSVGNDASATNPWGYGTKYPLHKQKFKSGFRATDGRLIVPTSFSTIVLRLNASGGSGSDEWAAKNVVAHIQAVDNAAPTKLGVSVDPGIHAKGDTVYVSVAFSEIVVVSGTPYLSTENNWGTLKYYAGSGTNVLTFRGAIPTNASGYLNITGLTGTVKDLAGNNLSGNVTAGNLCPLDASYAWPITYDLAGGTASNPATYTWETATFTLANPTRDGYTFDGWTGSNGNEPQATVTIVTGSHKPLSYTAHWTPTVYNISYTLDGGSVATSNPESYTIETPDFTLVNPTRDNYIFLGWTGIDLAAPTKTVTIAQGSIGDRSYTANWYPLWGIASGADGSAVHPYLIATTIDLDTLAARVGRGNSYSGTYFLQTADVTYDGTSNNYTPVGRLEANPFAGTYDGGGHTISGININTSANNIGLFGRLSTGATVQNLTLASTTITAHFNVGGIVGYNGGGTVQNCRVESTVTINANISAAHYHGGVVGYNYSGTIEGCRCAATVSRNGYSTCYYYGGITGNHHAGTIRDCLFTGPTPTSDVSAKGSIAGARNNSASLTNNYYTVSTLGGVQGDDVAGACRARTVTLGTDVALVGTETAYSHSGLTAIGTTALRLAGGTLYSGAGQTLTLAYTGSDVASADQHYCFSYNDGSDHLFFGNTLTMPDADITVSYVGIVYTISYDLAGGSVATPNPVFYTADSADITLVNPTRDHYTFAGWTGTELDAATETVTIAHGSTGDRSYTATWTPIVYSISYDLAGGSVATPNPTSYTVESAIFTLANPTRTGYDFAGWTGTGLAAPTMTVTIAHDSPGDRSYTATWTLTVYTISYDLAGGSVATPNPTSYTVESTDITLVNPTQADNTFAGWMGTGLSELTTTVTIPHGSTGDRSYTAVWHLTTLPYSYDFETEGDWDYWKSLSGNNRRTSGYSSHSGSYYLKFQGSTSNVVALPPFDAAPSSLQLSFWSRPERYYYEKCGTFSVGYLTDPTDTATFVALRTYSYSDWTSDDYRRKVGNFEGAPDGSRLAFRHNPTATNYFWFVDDVEVTAPGCFVPEELAVSNISSGAATVSWLAATGTQWEYALVANAAADYTPTESDFSGTFTASQAGTQSITFSTLTEITPYTFFLRRVCSEQSKSEVVTVRFRTRMTPTAVPFADDFESSNGWMLENGTLTNQWVWGTAAHSGEGTRALYISNDGGTSNAYSADETRVFAWKSLSFEEGYYHFSYDWRAEGYGSLACLHVFLVPDETELTAGGELPNGRIPLHDGEYLGQEDKWQHVATDTIAVAAGTYKMVFEWGNDNNDNYDPPAAVDNVRIAKCKHFVTAGSWNDGANWSPAGVPDADDGVFIQAAAVIPDGYVARCDKAYIDGGSVTIADGGQLLCNSDIPVTVQKAVAAGQWNGISGLFDVYDLTSLTTGAAYDLFSYDEEHATWRNQKADDVAAGFSGLGSFEGYIYRRAANAISDLATINYNRYWGVIYYASCSDDALRGFNLAGNPCTHDLYFGTGITIDEGGSIAPGFYTLNADGTWRAHTTADPIHVAEAFLIQVTTDEAVCYFKNTNAAPAQSKAASAATLAFSVKGNGHEDVTYAMLADGDGLRKMPHLTAEAPSLSIDGYAIASLGSDVEAFPLTLKAQPGEYTIGLTSPTSPTSLSYCHLIDRLAGCDIDLLRDSTYTFRKSSNQAITDRFLVKLSPDAQETHSPHFAHWDGDRLVVTGEGTLEAYDVMGRQLFTKEISPSTSLLSPSIFPAAGVYVLRLGGQSQKIVVK